jgi:membrane-associated protease RseP (regulator of RpoE activity)
MYIVFYLIQFVLAYLLVVTVHELGHLMVGMLSGYRFELFVIGPLGIKRTQGEKIVCYLEKNPSMWGGVSLALPVKEDKKNIDIFAKILLGGPLMSLVFGLLLIFLFIVFPYQFLLLSGAISVAISISTSIPMRTGCFYSDGGRWLRIVRKGNAYKIEVALYNIVQSSVVHDDCSRLDMNDVEVLMADDDKRTQYMGHYYAYLYSRDNKMDEGMAREKQLLKALEGSVPKNFVKMLDLDS